MPFLFGKRTKSSPVRTNRPQSGISALGDEAGANNLAMVTFQQTLKHINTRTSRQMFWYLSGLFICTHAIYALFGIRFNDQMIVWAWHYLDPMLLRTRLLESVFYLHSQPPLFNLFLGLVLKLFPGNEQQAFQACYLSLGFLFYLSLFMTMRMLSIERPIALVLSTVFMLSPSFVLYEHWLYYTFPLAALLVISTLLLQKFLDVGQIRYAYWFCGTLAVISGIRSLFHFGYYVLLISVLVIVSRGLRKQLLQAALIPGLLIFGLYAKNWILFGEFTSSSWLGMSMWKISGRQVPLPVRERLVATGKLSPLTLIEVYSPIEKYPESYRGLWSYEMIPSLAEPTKSTGSRNLNHLAIIGISNQYKADSLYVLRHYPQAYLTGIAGAAFGYFKTSSDLEFLDTNRKKIWFINSVYNYLGYGKVPFDILNIHAVPIKSDKPQFFYLFLLVGLPLLIMYGLRLIFKGQSLNSSQRIVVGYICYTIIYVTVISTLLEIGENNRIRFMIDSLYLILFALFVQNSKYGRWCSNGCQF